MRGQKICATQGAYFNRPMSQRYLLDLLMYGNTRDALLALRDGRCIGFLYSSGAVQAYLKKPEWAGYKAPLPLAMLAPWAITISRNEQDTELDHLLGDIVAAWHRSGFLIEREKSWGIQATKFLTDAQILWNKRDEGGKFLCERAADGHWPTTCRNVSFVRSDEVGGLQKLGLWINENTGMNLTFIYDPYDSTSFVKGLAYSVALMGCCIFFSLTVGSFGAFIVESRFRFLGRLVRGISVWGRMTPPLLWMYLLFFGVGASLWSVAGIRLSPFWVAVWCLSFYTSASVMNSMLESTQHFRTKHPGFRLDRSNFYRVVELSSGPVKAALVNVVKMSVMASAIAVPELITATTSIMSDQGNVGVMMNAFLLVFIVLITIWLHLIEWLERSFRSLERRFRSQPAKNI
jgi:polar amino acid transport system substrate-binding protein